LVLEVVELAWGLELVQELEQLVEVGEVAVGSVHLVPNNLAFKICLVRV